MKQLYLVATALLISASLHAQTTYPSGVTGCIGRWDFSSSGTITSLPDVSGNNNNGYVRGGITADADFRGIVNRAMKFNGTSAYASVPHAANLNPTAISMLAVVNYNAFYSGSCEISNILSKGSGNGSSGVYQLGTYDNVFDPGCGVFSPNNQQTHYLLGSANGTAPYPQTAGNYFQTGKWYLSMVGYNGTAVVIYKLRMDSLYIPSVSPIFSATGGVAAIGSNSDSLAIGKYKQPGYPYWLNGTLDEIVLFNKMLSNTEVQSVYDYLWGVVKINTLTATTFCTGGNVVVNYTVANPNMCQPGNIFSVQLSNANGSFANPIVIGTVASTNSGSITCTIPAGTPAGTGYRIRIATSLPAYVNPENTANITIGSTPAPIINTNSPLCAGDTLHLSTAPGASYLWIGPGGFTSASQNPQINQVTLVNEGVYKLQVTDANGCKSDTAYSTVTIASGAALPTVSSNSPICFGDTLFLTAMGNSPGYTWHGPANFSSTQQNPHIAGVTPVNAGTYWVIASNGNCVSDTVFTTVSVQAQLEPPSAISNSPLCEGQTLQLNAAGSPGTYQWQGPAGFGSSLQNPQINGVSLANAGVYAVRAVLGDCTSEPGNVAVNISAIAPATVTVSATPGTFIQPGQLVVFNAFTTNGGANPTFAWFINGVVVPGATTNTFSTTALQSNDEVSVALYSANPCAQPNADTAAYKVYYTSVGNVQNTLQGISLYPNPTQGMLHLQGVLPGAEAGVEVYNTLGQRVYNTTLAAPNHKLDATIHLNKALANGLYQIRVSSQGQVFTSTVSVEQ